MAWETKPDMVVSAKEWKEQRELKLSVLAHRYAKWADMWENEYDDRRVMHNTYHMIVDGLNSIKAPVNVVVLVAVNEWIAGEKAMMDRIIDRFKGKEAV